MKNKILVVALISVTLGCGMVLVGCGLFGCPGGGNSGGIGKCHANLGEKYRQCIDNCITNRAVYRDNNNNYYFYSSLSCNCS